MKPTRQSPDVEQSAETTFPSCSLGDEGVTKVERSVAASNSSALPPSLSEGSKYTLIRKLGSGGMGEVYLAEHTDMHRLVAIKVLRRDLLKDQEPRRRFKNEVRAISRLSHPNVIAAHDAQLDDGDDCYLVTEYIDGSDLAQRVTQSPQPIPVHQAVAWTIQAATGLQHALETGLVHRDVKPQNLLVTQDGIVKVGDFGLAMVRDFDQTQALTGSGVILGSVDYMSPEQASNSSAADTRSDIYSLGCTLFYLLSSSPPFAGGSVVEKLQRHATDARPRPTRSDLPPGLLAVLSKMMDRDPRKRFQQPREVAEALQPYAKPAVQSQSAPPRWRYGWIAAGLLPLAILAGLYLTLPFGDGELVIQSDVDHVKVEVRQADKLVRIVDTDTGSTISLKPGQYTLSLSDTQNDQLSVSMDSVVLKRGSQTIVNIKYKPRRAAGANSNITGKSGAPTDTLWNDLAAMRMPAKLSLYLKPHKLNEHGLVTLSGQHWSVSDAYRGIGADGNPVVDQRITMFVTNSDESFSSAIVKLSREAAAKLVEALNSQLAQRIAHQDAQDPMTTVLSTQPYTLDSNQVVHQGDEHLKCVVLPSYLSVDSNNQRAVDERITLVVEDDKHAFWPLIVRMNESVVRKLSDDLQAALNAPASDSKPPTSPKSFVGIYRDSQGRKLDVSLDQGQLIYKIHWGINGPISQGHVVATADDSLLFQQPGESNPITVTRDTDNQRVVVITLLNIKFEREP